MGRFVAAFTIGLAIAASAAFASQGEVVVAIHEPVSGVQLQRWELDTRVTGGASVFGGVKHMDLFLVLDSSKSLQRTDRDDYRKAAAIALVRNLSPTSDIRFGLVEFDTEATLASALTTNREAVVGALGQLDRSGGTDLAAGIEMGLEGFAADPRPDTTRVMLLFTDGKSDEEDAIHAMEKARAMNVVIHTLLLGSDSKGERILRGIAEASGGSFVHVADPARLPEAFLGLRTTGIDYVMLRVNESDPIRADLDGGTFSARVPLWAGENEIVATATSLDGRTASNSVTVTVSGPLELAIDAPLDGTVFVARETDAIVEGSVVGLRDPSPEYLARYPNQGVERVELTVNDSVPVTASLHNGRFRGLVQLETGANRISARAVGTHGGSADASVAVTVRPPGCGELHVAATRDGRPALSISDRAVEIVFDASNSMWGRIDDRAKIGIAKATLEDALDWLPPDLSLALRAYGHRSGRKERDCRDSELLVPPGSGNRERIRESIASLSPKGWTPLAYSLERIADDLGDVAGERAVVLVTDGIESCGGDPAAAAQALRERSDVRVHVIGFGIEGDADGDLASLRSIAEAGGGRFLTAGTAEELRDALRSTAGTSYRVLRDGATVAGGTLGTEARFRLPADEYAVAFDSTPPQVIPLTLRSEESVTLAIARSGDSVSHGEERTPAEYYDCEAAVPTPWPAHPDDGD